MARIGALQFGRRAVVTATMACAGMLVVGAPGSPSVATQQPAAFVVSAAAAAPDISYDPDGTAHETLNYVVPGLGTCTNTVSIGRDGASIRATGRAECRHVYTSAYDVTIFVDDAPEKSRGAFCGHDKSCGSTASVRIATVSRFVTYCVIADPITPGPATYLTPNGRGTGGKLPVPGKLLTDAVQPNSGSVKLCTDYPVPKDPD